MAEEKDSPALGLNETVGADILPVPKGSPGNSWKHALGR